MMEDMQMVRTQLQLDDKTYDAVRSRAHRERKSMSAVVREILQAHLEPKETVPVDLRKRFSFIGSGSSGRSDISVRHDEALDEDFQ